MKNFLTSNHLSEILEQSNRAKTIIFKYSSECGSSDRLLKKIEDAVIGKQLLRLIYIVTVQKQPVLSKKIEDYFGIKHESPQIIVLHKNKVTYTAHHNSINIEDMVK